MRHRSTEARVIEYLPPTQLQLSGRVEVACPYCKELDRWRRKTKTPGRHLHGLGHAGQAPDLGDRVSHCVTSRGRGYVIVDPDHLVPDVMTIEAVTA